MNLTGKEFVSCRIYRGKPGVLLLSPFIGAAEIMQVGPGVSTRTVRRCDAGGAHCQPVRGVPGGGLPPQVTSQIISWTYPDLYSALTMSVAEAEVRMTALRARERAHDLRHWTDSFLSQLLDSAADGARADKVAGPDK